MSAHISEERQHSVETMLSQDVGKTVVVVDFGSQYSQLIARRVRELRVYSHLVPYDTTWETVSRLNPGAVILSGGPSSVYDPNAPRLPDWILDSGLPVLAICYGLQLIAHEMGGQVVPANVKEYGPAELQVEDENSPLFDGLPKSQRVWMSHGDSVISLPEGFWCIGSTAASPYSVVTNGRIYGLQFHPEVVHTHYGREIISNFLFKIAGLEPLWTPSHFIEESIQRIKDEVGQAKVICALSGGVDSSVAATLIHKAIGDRLVCIFVNNGLLRLNEAEEVLGVLRDQQHLNIRYVDATDKFLSVLHGVTDPEEKRKRIGECFIRVFEEEASKLGEIEFLAQGTLYPDVIESATADTKAAAKIKTHHNVGGLPPDLKFKLLEPLKYLFKDEVREVGKNLGLPDHIVYRHPFPGPGLAVRIIGEVTPERLDIVRKCDAIVRQEIEKAGMYREIWQAFAVLTPIRTVGVMGDARTYGYLVAVRAVTSEDAMTAHWARIPYDVLDSIGSRIVNEVHEVTRVVYDITNKPPGTIEWE